MKKFFLIPLAALLVAACSLVGTESGDCLSRVAAAEVTITESYETTTKLFVSDIISKETAKKAVKAIDTANDLTDNAVKLCSTNETKALQYLTDALGFLSTAKKLIGE